MSGRYAYPEGTLWRCGSCDFTCDDDGPDYCPNDGRPLSRTMAVIRRRPTAEPSFIGTARGQPHRSAEVVACVAGVLGDSSTIDVYVHPEKGGYAVRLTVDGLTVTGFLSRLALLNDPEGAPNVFAVSLRDALKCADWRDARIRGTADA